MIVRVRVYSYVDMKALLAAEPALLDQHTFVSILTSCSKERPDWWVLPTDNARGLTVFYDDINSKTARIFERDWTHRRPKQMTPEDAQAIVAHLRANHARAGEETLYVHCAQGISRSGAVAILAQEMFGLSAEVVRADNPRIDPNDRQLPMLRQAAGLS